MLAEAQKLGYAEADPSFDIDGIDAAHKLAILTSVAFGCPVDFRRGPHRGHPHVSALDIDYADELGYRIKLLGIARRNDGGVEQRVHPAMVPSTRPSRRSTACSTRSWRTAISSEKVTFVGRGAGAGRPRRPWSPTWWTWRGADHADFRRPIRPSRTISAGPAGGPPRCLLPAPDGG